ncbi:protein phosphatase 2C domain-containing protein [Streptomyces radicis]|uniref:Zinc-ribbon domain-containing protein n=1 Tax=Streptomyces radicis TaxID=1750517 RepID=A0A3A9WE84_9ACTN|nr:protein phosphatase 2C domain-containing protein [Streptomyces radicis]RKN11080.1 zinc-ribbon domain-containing protein [Streptomyces radicis]RKN25343.1 zinc-ribbon domain-containing protein [Streptomyces radicis]
MPQLDQLSACPGCGEPLEDDDRFCGVCGTDLRSASREAAPPPSPAAAPPAAPAPAPAPPVPPAPPGYPVPPSAAPAPASPPAHEPAPHAGRTPTEPDFTLPPPLRADAEELPPPSGPPVSPAPPPPPGAAPAEQPPQPPYAQPQSAQPRSAPRAPAARPDPRIAHDGAPTAADRPLCAVCGQGQVDPDGYCVECGRAQPDDRDHVERALGGVAAVSDLGLRHHRNEDAFTVSATALSDGSPAVLAVVCDGVSSSSRPHEASATAAEAALESLLAALPRGVGGQRAMHDALHAAATAVAALAETGEQEPGRNAPACTIVSAVTTGQTLTVGWIGDSRAYWVPEEEGAAPARLTQDDSWAAQMVAAGLLSEAEAMADHRAHAITAWLGADAQEIDPHTRSFEPDRPGVVIVCTDGLWNYAETADEMARIVPAKARSAPLPSAQHLVRHALESGGHDNVTVAVIPFPTEPDRAETA